MPPFPPKRPRRLACQQPRGLNGLLAIPAGKGGRASRLVTGQPIDIREIHAFQTGACGCEFPAGGAAPRSRGAGSMRTATKTAADSIAQSESAHSRRRGPAVTGGRQVTPFDDRTTRRPSKRGEHGAGTFGKIGHAPSPGRIAAHASLGTNRPCVEVTARGTDPTVRAAGTSCVALFGIELRKRLLNRYQHSIASSRQFGDGATFIGRHEPLFQQPCVRLVQFR